ncbi:MAG: hypothetical protein KJZ76_17495 [Burkholderiaceae bacterium]|nr:hypothetical protein [Burkholderiaceae bacterium]
MVAVAAVHTVFAAIVFLPQWQDIVQRGVFDSVGSDPMRGAVAWFGLFGAALALLGWAIALLERSPTHASAALRPLGMGVLALTLLGIALMPASGFWLALPPALALCASTPQAARP